MPRNPFHAIRGIMAHYNAREEKMAYEQADRAGSPMQLAGGALVKPRTFKEQVQDNIAYHEAKIANLRAILDSMSPEVEKFVEALTKAEL